MWLQLSFMIVFLTLTASTTASTTTLGLRLQLSHVNINMHRNLTHPHLSKGRNERGLSQVDGHYIGNNYLLDVAIGTPAKKFTAVLSTGGDLVWAQCKPCKKCIAQQHGVPLFNPRDSSSFSRLSCSHELCSKITNKNMTTSTTSCAKGSSASCEFSHDYFGRTTAQGFLGKESFAFGSSGGGVVHVPNLVFGCGVSQRGAFASGSSGSIGLDRGPLSLVSQLKVGRFSHCFASDDDVTIGSPLFFGTLASKLDDADTELRSTVLLRNPAHPTFYYLPLEGITVGKTRLPIPPSTFELKRDGGGGTIVDSGFVTMHLNEAAFEQVSKAFRSQVDLRFVDGTEVTGYEICFESPKPLTLDELPEMILHFEGADMELPVGNYLGRSSGLMCVVAERSIYEWSIIGNHAIRDMHVLYDLEKEMLSFQPAKCSEL